MPLRFTRSFYIRHACVGGLALFFGAVLMLLLKQLGWMRFLAPVVFAGPWVFFVLREWRLSAKTVDDEGVTRRDGKRFLWTDLTKVQEAYMRMTPGQQGPLNHVDLIFSGGRVRILYLVLENGMAAIRFAKKKEAGRMDDLRQRLCCLIARRAQSGRKMNGTDGTERTERTNATTREWSHKEEQRLEPAWPERAVEAFVPPVRAREEEEK